MAIPRTTKNHGPSRLASLPPSENNGKDKDAFVKIERELYKLKSSQVIKALNLRATGSEAATGHGEVFQIPPES